VVVLFPVAAAAKKDLPAAAAITTFENWMG